MSTLDYLLGVGALALILITVPVFFQLGSEFMPPLDEGTLLYMPTTMPGLSVTEAQKLMQTMDQRLKVFPEVERLLTERFGARLLLLEA